MGIHETNACDRAGAGGAVRCNLRDADSFHAAEHANKSTKVEDHCTLFVLFLIHRNFCKQVLTSDSFILEYGSRDENSQK